MKIDANGMYYKQLNEIIAKSGDKTIAVDNVCGQRYIGCGLSDYDITVNGTPGNALAAYMNGATVTINGDAQDATGDTMNGGRIVIHGHCGDTCGYAMRGGEIYIRDDTGCRTGIHMKAYKEMRPVIVIGGKVGDFFGEYLAGGILLVLGIHVEGPLVGSFCGTGMHGGVIYIRGSEVPVDLPKQVKVDKLTSEDLDTIGKYAGNYARFFGGDVDKILKSGFIKLIPNSSNPYKQLYTRN